jgi:DNA-binding NarL/FixJ family response regulator
MLKELASRSDLNDSGLTSRERDILPLLAEGLQNKQIARELGLSEQTVRNHLSGLYRKLGTSNRTETIAVSRRRGLLS